MASKTYCFPEVYTVPADRGLDIEKDVVRRQASLKILACLPLGVLEDTFIRRKERLVKVPTRMRVI